VKYEVLTQGKVLDFRASAGTTFILPRGTIDEVRWKGPTHRIAVAMHPSLLVNALDETAHEREIELVEHWNLMDPNIMAVLLALTTDLGAGSPAGRLCRAANSANQWHRLRRQLLRDNNAEAGCDLCKKSNQHRSAFGQDTAINDKASSLGNRLSEQPTYRKVPAIRRVSSTY
jgi:hypothetical protein